MKTIEVLLANNVENLGIVGDVVRVKPGYARNYLVPHGLAMPPTQGNIKRLAGQRAEMEKIMQKRRAEHEGMLAKLEGFELTLTRSANEQGSLFGGVSARDVAEAMAAEGFEVEEKAVRLHAPIKRLDSYEVLIALANDLKTTIKLWVVSDKPAEELESGEEDQASETEPASEAATSDDAQAVST